MRLCLAIVLAFCAPLLAQSQADPHVLTAAEGAALMPPAVTFAGKSATIQARNTAAVEWPDHRHIVAAMVDSSGYASNVQQKYQAYLITQIPVSINNAKTLPAGEYGIGFVPGTGFVVMNTSGRDLFVLPFRHDDDIRRPRPLLMVTGADNVLRLYMGRDYVTLTPAPEPPHSS